MPVVNQFGNIAPAEPTCWCRDSVLSGFPLQSKTAATSSTAARSDTTLTVF